MGRAGMIEVAASLSAYLVIITSLIFALNYGILNLNQMQSAVKMGDAIDKMQVILNEQGYVDRASGNAYPIIDLSKKNSTSVISSYGFTVEENTSVRLYFPVLIYASGTIREGFLETVKYEGNADTY